MRAVLRQAEQWPFRCAADDPKPAQQPMQAPAGPQAPTQPAGPAPLSSQGPAAPTPPSPPQVPQPPQPSQPSGVQLSNPSHQIPSGSTLGMPPQEQWAAGAIAGNALAPLYHGKPGGGGPGGGGSGGPQGSATPGGSPPSAGTPDASGILPNARPLYDQLKHKYPGADIGGYRVDNYHEHDRGAMDFMTGDPNQAHDVMQQAFAAGAPYVLYQQRQWNADGTSSPMPDRGSPTQNHMDHVHIAPFTPSSNIPAGRTSQRRSSARFVAVAPGDDSWMPGETAHFEYHLTHPGRSDYRLWRRTQQPVQVLGPGTDPYADRSFRVQFRDGHEGLAAPDELLPHPGHFNPEHAYHPDALHQHVHLHHA